MQEASGNVSTLLCVLCSNHNRTDLAPLPGAAVIRGRRNPPPALRCSSRAPRLRSGEAR